MNSEHDFDVYIQYADAMGNIGGITRQGLIGNDSDDEPVYGQMDGLSYSYTSGVLTGVTESGNPDFGYLGAETGFMYEHGKLVSAAGRGILSIRYNELNLPAQITTPEGVIDILYDAEGVKWYQRTKWDENPPASYPGGEEVKVYTNGLELINGAPAALYNSHGRAVLNADGSLQQHEFFLSDHLGNTRVVFADLNGDGELDFSAGTAEVLQTNSYYPFGMPIEGMTPMDATDPAQHYLYNGKERSLLAGLYDYGARWYDPSIGRWGVVDPLASRGPQWSPYVYTFNNPIRYADPDGRWPIETIWDIGNVIYDIGAAVVDHVRGDHAAARGHWGDLGMDAGAMLIPYVPAGASKLRYADDVVEAAMKHGGDAKKAAKIDMAKESGEFAKIGSTGKVGENYLKGLGGDSQKYFATKAGEGGRYVDQFVDGVAHEAKTGYTTLTKDIQQQIAKDAELLANPNSGVKKVVWNFFESPTTGKAGASKPLLEALQKAGIETTIIK